MLKKSKNSIEVLIAPKVRYHLLLPGWLKQCFCLMFLLLFLTLPCPKNPQQQSERTCFKRTSKRVTAQLRLCDWLLITLRIGCKPLTLSPEILHSLTHPAVWHPLTHTSCSFTSAMLAFFLFQDQGLAACSPIVTLAILDWLPVILWFTIRNIYFSFCPSFWHKRVEFLNCWEWPTCLLWC